MDRSSPATAGGRDRRARARRVVEVALSTALGAALGSLLLLVAAGGRPFASRVVLFAVVGTNTSVLVVEQRRPRRRAEAMEHGNPAPTTPAPRRPLVRRAYALAS